MRAVMFAVLVAGCSADIANGSYLCGPEQACPEGQACNGADNVCVLPAQVQPFSCPADADNSIATARQLPKFDCVSVPHIEHDCLAAGDAEDWEKFHVESVCANSKAEVRLTYPVAFEPLAVELWSAGSMIAADSECKDTPEPGTGAACIEMPLIADGDYAVRVIPAGGGDCDGTCNYNRYDLQIQLVTQ